MDVSVITAAHNASEDIERAIRSVAAQSLKPAEHIVIDDGSVDETAEIVRELQRQIPHLVLIQQERRGAGAARNAGIVHAKARFVAFLDADDYWSEQKLEAQIAFMRETGAAFSYGDYEAVDAMTGFVLGRYCAPDEVSYAELLRGCPIGCLTVAFDQAVLGKQYMPEVRRGQDWALWLTLTRSGTVARRYPGCYASYRLSKRSLSSSKLAKVGDVYRIYRKQEGFGHLQSIRCMLPHLWSAMTKRPVPIETVEKGEFSTEAGLPAPDDAKPRAPVRSFE